MAAAAYGRLQPQPSQSQCQLSESSCQVPTLKVAMLMVCCVRVCGLCVQQGKQLVMHAIKPRDKPQVVTPGKGDRVMMGLLNTIYTTKKNEETGLPEPVVKYEVRFDGGSDHQACCWHSAAVPNSSCHPPTHYKHPPMIKTHHKSCGRSMEA